LGGLDSFRLQFPGVPVTVMSNNHLRSHPSASAVYESGRTQKVCLKNMDTQQVAHHLYFLRSQWGNRVQGVNVDRTSFFAGVKKRVYTEQKSIQGRWEPPE